MNLFLAAVVGAPTPAPDSARRPADTADVGVVVEKETDPTVFPDPKKFSRGFFAEASTGVGIPVGPTADVLGPGFGGSVRLGYEIRRWIALGAHANATIGYFDDGVLTRELFQQYAYTGEVRLGVPFRRYVIGVQAGGGAYQLSNNLLQIPGIAPDNRLWGFAWDGSVFFDVHTLSRHFSGGLVATFIGTPRLQNAGTVMVQAYFRYTL